MVVNVRLLLDGCAYGNTNEKVHDRELRRMQLRNKSFVPLDILAHPDDDDDGTKKQSEEIAIVLFTDLLPKVGRELPPTMGKRTSWLESVRILYERTIKNMSLV